MRAADSADFVLYSNELRYTDVFINFPESEDPDSFWNELSADSARASALRAVHALTRARVDSARNASKARFVYVNYPPVRAALTRSGLDSAAFSRMQWSAVTTDHALMERAGARIAQLLERGRVMQITTAAGTDLRFPLAGRPVTVNAGVIRSDFARARVATLRTVTLPGGQLLFAPLETAASGRVVLPRARCEGQPLVRARFELRAGRVSGFSADSGGACVTSYLSRNASPADRLGYIMIGLNPALQPVESGSGYFPGLGSGVVHIGLGYNTDIGGVNSTPVEKSFPLLRATVKIDGTVVLREGRFTDSVTRSP
jgi:leucyl aminopeptidase (aminopeptidase T)